MRVKKPIIVVLLAGGLSAVAQITTDSSSSTFMQEMDISMKRMDHDMTAAPMTGNADHDFAAMMTPHHQGAIDMAKGELKFGQDPVMRRLAQEIIVGQQSEMDVMNLWLRKHSDAAK